MDPSFRAPFWLASAHLQTLGASLPFWSPPRAFQPSEREDLRIPLPDGGALHALASWQPGPEPRAAAIVVHGVGGSRDSRYVVRAVVSLYRAGFHAIALDLRGAGGSIADAPTLYHAGLTADPRAALDHVAAQPRVSSVALVGFSLGGHVVLRLAGELGREAPRALSAVVSISAPLDLTLTTRAIERRRSYPYQRYVLQNLLAQGRAFALAHPERAAYAPEALAGVRTIRAYDTLVVAPMHGFASAEDYYERASAGPLVSGIMAPTLLVHAEDDPMVPADSVRAWLKDAPLALEQAWTDRGGHVGWFSGMAERSWIDTWAMVQTVAFLNRHAGA